MSLIGDIEKGLPSFLPRFGSMRAQQEDLPPERLGQDIYVPLPENLESASSVRRAERLGTRQETEEPGEFRPPTKFRQESTSKSQMRYE